MEKFFEVKGTTSKKIEEIFVKVGVIPLVMIAVPTIFVSVAEWKVVGIMLASIYLFVFYFMTQRNK